MNVILESSIALKLYSTYPPLAAMWLFMPSVTHEHQRERKMPLSELTKNTSKQATKGSQIKN